LECKNWSGAIGRPEYSLFESKMRNRRGRCTLGFIISWNGAARTIELEQLRGSREEFAIAILTGSQIREAIKRGDFATIITQAVMRAVAH
jgi:hypothetical protein